MDFEGRIRELESMVGFDVSMDMFNDAYESLLNEVKALPGPRYEKLGKMRALVYRQFMFLFRRWREEKGMEGQGSGEEEITAGMN